ncbi:hypothetical protein L6R52_07155 [Myxococcota bacterium]|nr:hypothetical protein [Myxococcota bacterium]
MRRLLVTSSLALLSGCALDAGHGFATVRSAEVGAALEPGAARDLGDHTVLTDLGYHVAITSASIGIDRVELRGIAAASSGGGVFDPADPPPGYSLCHGGHCHHESGRLVSYEDIQAELSGGAGPTESVVVTIPVGETFDLLTATPRPIPLDALTPSPELPKTSLSRGLVHVTTLALEATATRGALGEESVALSIAIDVSAPVAKGLFTAIDRDGPGELDVVARARLDGAIFDGLDLAALATDGHITWTDTGTTGAEQLVSSLLGTEPALTLTQD